MVVRVTSVACLSSVWVFILFKGTLWRIKNFFFFFCRSAVLLLSMLFGLLIVLSRENSQSTEGRCNKRGRNVADPPHPLQCANIFFFLFFLFLVRDQVSWLGSKSTINTLKKTYFKSDLILFQINIFETIFIFVFLFNFKLRFFRTVTVHIPVIATKLLIMISISNFSKSYI